MAEYVDPEDLGDGVMIYRRAGCRKGYWHYRIAVRPSGSKTTYLRKSTGTTDKNRARKVAFAAAQEVHRRVETGRPAVARTLGEVAEAFVRSWETKQSEQQSMASANDRRLTKSRHYAYVNQTRKHIIPLLGSKQIDKIDQIDVENFREALAEKGLSISSVNNYLSTLAVIFRYATLQKEVERSFLPVISRQRQESEARGEFSEGEVSDLIEMLLDRHLDQGGIWSELFHYVAALVATGQRPSTVERLLVGDVIPVSDGKMHIRVQTRKGGRTTERTISADPRYGYHLINCIDGRDASERLFPHSAPHYGRLFRAFLDSEGMRYDHAGRVRSVYSLRHFYITSALQDFDVLVVAKNTLTSVQMIDRHYDRRRTEGLYEKLDRDPLEETACDPDIEEKYAEEIARFNQRDADARADRSRQRERQKQMRSAQKGN